MISDVCYQEACDFKSENTSFPIFHLKSLLKSVHVVMDSWKRDRPHGFFSKGGDSHSGGFDEDVVDLTLEM